MDKNPRVGVEPVRSHLSSAGQTTGPSGSDVSLGGVNTDKAILKKKRMLLGETGLHEGSDTPDRHRPKP